MCLWDYEMRVPWSQTNHNGAPWGPDNINAYHLYHLSICLSYICLHTQRGFIVFFSISISYQSSQLNKTQQLNQNAKPLLVLLSFRSFQVVNVVKINVNFLGRHLRNPEYLPGVFKQKVFLRSKFEVFWLRRLKYFWWRGLLSNVGKSLGPGSSADLAGQVGARVLLCLHFDFFFCFRFDILAS